MLAVHRVVLDRRIEPEAVAVGLTVVEGRLQVFAAAAPSPAPTPAPPFRPLAAFATLVGLVLLGRVLGLELRLVMSDEVGAASDRGVQAAVSIISGASVADVAAAGGAARLDARRFRMLFEVDDGTTLVVHLMTAGRLAFVQPGEKKPGNAVLSIPFADGSDLVVFERATRRSVRVGLYTAEALESELAGLGPEPPEPVSTGWVARTRDRSGASVAYGHRTVIGRPAGRSLCVCASPSRSTPACTVNGEPLSQRTIPLACRSHGRCVGPDTARL